jgi:exopolysaccharide production protein ExoZ
MPQPAITGSGVLRYSNVELLRFIAALGVVVYHSLGTMKQNNFDQLLPEDIYEVGAAGVDLFFVISGFVIYLGYLRNPKQPKQFAKDRLRRIVPAYWILTTLAVLVTFVYHAIGQAWYLRDVTPAWYFESVLFVSRWFGNEYPVISQGWTLEFEALFYALVFVALFFRNKVVTFLLPCLALAVAASVGLVPDIVIEFILGAVIALVMTRVKTPSWVAILSLVLGIFGFLLPVLGLSLAAPRWVEFGIPSVLVLLGAIHIPQLKGKLVTVLGSASYPVYLIQWFTIPVVVLIIERLGHGLGFALVGLLSSVLIAEAAGIAYDRYVDKPISRRLRQRSF